MTRILLALTLAGGPIFAELKSNGVTVNMIDLWADAQAGIAGDTYHFTAWSGSGSGGNFNGGRIYGSYNDGSGCPGGGNIAFLELTVLDWSTKSNTHVNCVNSMSSFGTAVNQPAGWSDGNAWKSYNPTSYNGVIYWPVNRQEQSNPWNAYMSTMMMSPDRGVHWCNPATWAAHTGSAGCDSSNWQANGDAPPNSSTGMMWGSVGVKTNPMARPVRVQFCQDETCTGMPFDADNYLYFDSMDGTNGPTQYGVTMYAACVAKSPAAIMDATQWWYHTTGNATCGDPASWTHNIASAVPVAQQKLAGTNFFQYPSSILYIAAAKQFLMFSYNTDGKTMLLSSDYPWGPWKRFATSPSLPPPAPATGNGQGGFPSANLAWLDSSCAGCNSHPGRWRITYATSVYGHAPAASLYLWQIEIVNGGPVTGGSGPVSAPVGVVELGTLRIRANKDGTNNRLTTRGLVRAYAMDDYLDMPSTSWSAPGTGLYVSELTGSGNCLVVGNNASGSMAWGTPSGTAGTSFVAGGITANGYSPFFNGIGGNCAGTPRLPLSGDAAFTVQMIVKPTNITSNKAGLLSISDPANYAGHKGFYIQQNRAYAGGNHIDVGDYTAKYVTTTVSWSAGSYYLLTVVKTPGVVSPSTVKVYIGTTPFTGTVTGSDDGLPPNLPATTRLVLACMEQPTSKCETGGSDSALPATYSFFALYDRALSADEVARNYSALKAAMAQAPRSVTLQ